MRAERLGPLTCRVVGGQDGYGGGRDEAAPIVVLLHGFGAPGTDLVPLGGALDAPCEVRFVFPEAPLTLPAHYYGGRAWWHIDFAQLERAMQGGGRGDLTREVPAGMPEARAMVSAMLDAVAERFGGAPLVLGGFSQGAMLSLDVALHDARPLAGLALLSGTLLARDEWVPRMPQRRGLPVVQSHGTDDPLLPYPVAEELRGLLTAAGLPVDFVPFRGGHTIPDAVLARLSSLIATVARNVP